MSFREIGPTASSRPEASRSRGTLSAPTRPVMSLWVTGPRAPDLINLGAAGAAITTTITNNVVSGNFQSGIDVASGVAEFIGLHDL